MSRSRGGGGGGGRTFNFDNVFFLLFFSFSFLVDEGWEDPNTTISMPSSARQQRRWRADEGPTLNADSIAS